MFIGKITHIILRWIFLLGCPIRENLTWVSVLLLLIVYRVFSAYSQIQFRSKLDYLSLLSYYNAELFDYPRDLCDNGVIQPDLRTLLSCIMSWLCTLFASKIDVGF